jgi:hypothetical protein
MDDFHRQIQMDAERQKKRRKFDAHGLHHHQCVICGEDDPLCLEEEHIAGRAHDDAKCLVCTNCHRKKSASERCDPSPGPSPRNVFEVIGRWLLGIASYFELLTDTLRRFGEFLINLAKAGYGDDLQFEW